MGLYVHLPFCFKKCRYCNYVTRIYRREREDSFVQSLRKEIQLLAREGGPLRLSSIYLGGGTPSTFSLESLALILSLASRYFDTSSLREVTCEVNPKGLKLEYLTGLREIGINRLSMGIQSFTPSLLRLLGREHNVEEACTAIYLAQEAGIASLNLDLLFAIPGQTYREWEKTLKKALSFSVEHLSLYNLQIEEKTLFHKWVREGRLVVAHEELDYAMYKRGISCLQERGFSHYEISSFARPGYESLHNRLYWKNREYVGVGPGAWGYYQGERYGNKVSLREYSLSIERGERPLGYTHRPSLKERLEETFFMGLRLLKEGIQREEILEDLGVDPFLYYREEIHELVEKGLVEADGETIKLKREGLMVANQVMASFIKE